MRARGRGMDGRVRGSYRDQGGMVKGRDRVMRRGRSRRGGRGSRGGRGRGQQDTDHRRRECVG